VLKQNPGSGTVCGTSQRGQTAAQPHYALVDPFQRPGPSVVVSASARRTARARGRSLPIESSDEIDACADGAAVLGPETTGQERHGGGFAMALDPAL
jgi:hypothetical protein